MLRRHAVQKGGVEFQLARLGKEQLQHFLPGRLHDEVGCPVGARCPVGAGHDGDVTPDLIGGLRQQHLHHGHLPGGGDKVVVYQQHLGHLALFPLLGQGFHQLRRRGEGRVLHQGVQVLGAGEAVAAHGVSHLPAHGIHHVALPAHFPHLGHGRRIEAAAKRRVGRNGHDGAGAGCPVGAGHDGNVTPDLIGGLPLQRSQNGLQLLLVRPHVLDGLLRLAEFGRRHQLHGRCNLERVPHGRDPSLYFLQCWHYFRLRITDSAVSVRVFSISGVRVPAPRGSRTSALWVARRRSRKASWKAGTWAMAMSRMRPLVPQ